MSRIWIDTAFGEIFDPARLFHGFAGCMREYFPFICSTEDQRTHIVGPIEVIGEYRSTGAYLPGGRMGHH